MRRFWILVFAIWLGAGVGVSFLAIPEVFAASRSGEVTRLQSGRIAQAVLSRTFQAQYVFLVLAMGAHLISLGRSTNPPGHRFRTVLLVALAVLVLGGGLGLQPILRGLHRQMYDPALTEETQARAASRFGPLHGVSQVGNLAVMALLLTGLLNATAIPRPTPPRPKPDAEPE